MENKYYIPMNAMRQCVKCKNLIPRTLTCKAFPNGIPEEIQRGAWDHREAFPGDNGILYNPIDPDNPVAATYAKNKIEEKNKQTNESRAYIYDTAANGLLVRIPIEKYDQWKKTQEEIKKDQEQEYKVAVKTNNGHEVWIPQSKVPLFLEGQRKRKAGIRPQRAEEKAQEIKALLLGKANTEEMVTIDFGGYRRRTPRSKLHLAEQHAKEIQEVAMRAGRTKEEAEKLYYFKIVDEDEESFLTEEAVTMGDDKISKDFTKEEMVTIDFGGYKRRTLKSKLHLAEQHAKEIQEVAMRAGYTKEEAEKEFYFKIVDEDEEEEEDYLAKLKTTNPLYQAMKEFHEKIESMNPQEREEHEQKMERLRQRFYPKK